MSFAVREEIWCRTGKLLHLAVFQPVGARDGGGGGGGGREEGEGHGDLRHDEGGRLEGGLRQLPGQHLGSKEDDNIRV